MYPNTQSLETFKTASPLVPSDVMSESLFSAPFAISTTNQFLAQAFWTGSPVGTISVVGSQDGVTFNIPIRSIAAGGTSGSLTYDTFGTSVMFIRLAHTFTSGTGTLVCSASSKVSN